MRYQTYRHVKTIVPVALICLIIGLPTIASATTFFINQSTFPDTQGITTVDPWFTQNITTPNWTNTSLFNLDAVALRGRISGLSSTTMTITVSNSSFTFPNQTGIVGSAANTYYEITIPNGIILLNQNSVYNLTFTPNAPAGTIWLQNLNSLGNPYPGGRAFDAANTMGANSDLTFNVSLSQHDAVGVWHFNEGTGTFANDSSGFNNNGTVTNTTWANNFNNGSVNQSALSFDGFSNVSINSSDSLNLTTTGTIAAWIKTTNLTPPVNWGILAKSDNGLMNGYFIRQLNVVEGSGIVESGIFNGGTFKIAESNPNVISNNTWAFVLTSWNSTSINLYVNNVLVATMATSGMAAGLNNNPVGIGNDFITPTFTGTIDEVSMYNYVLNSSERTSLFQRFQPTPAAPVANTVLPALFPPLDTNVNFQWYDTMSSSDELIISEDQGQNIRDFDQIISNNPNGVTSTTVGLVAGKTYFWRVIGISASELQTFSIATPQVIAGNNTVQGIVYEILPDGSTSPIQGATVTIFNATFSDFKVTGANGYYIFQNLANTTYTINANLIQEYQPSDNLPVTPSNTGTVTQNILLQKCQAQLTCGLRLQFITFHLLNPFTFQVYPNVNVNAFKDDQLNVVASGTTSTAGTIKFYLLQDQPFRFTFINASQGISTTWTGTIPENGLEQYIMVTSNISSPFTGGNDNLVQVTTTVSTSIIDANNAFINISYNDAMGQTSNLTFFLNQSILGDQVNQTNLQSINGGSNQTFNASFIVSGYSGQSYIIVVTANHTTFGQINRGYGVNFPSNPFSAFRPVVVFMFAMALIMFFTGFWGQTSTEQGAGVIVALIWIIDAMGGWLFLPNQITFHLGLVLASILVIVMNINARSRSEAIS